MDIFNTMLSNYIKGNRLHLHIKTVYYLTSQDDNIDGNKSVLTLSQIGLLYNIDNKQFHSGGFDNELLAFLSKFRSRSSFIIKNKPDRYQLQRIVITNSTKEQRDSIDNFMGKNASKYPKFIRLTTTMTGFDEERVLDINYIKENERCLDGLKDVTLVFGY